MTYNHITSISSLPFLFWQRFLNWLGLAVVIEIVVIALLFVVGFLVTNTSARPGMSPTSSSGARA